MILKGTFPTEKFKSLATPFYFYDITLLKETLNTVKTEAGKYGYHVHYAVKANANPRILSIIAEYGLGADCVSGGEIQAALDAGFPARKIVYAGVGKTDWEINLGLDNDIFCFNVESAAELEILEELAAAKNKVASIALRINPEVDAHTHAKITTGMKENKFGINLSQLGGVLDKLKEMKHVKLIGIHSHIGSQITDMSSFRNLVIRFNEIQEELERAIDKHSKSIIASTIELLLNHCQRFYDRQFITRENKNKLLLARLDRMFDEYLDSGRLSAGGLPVLAQCAAALNLSAAYFSDLLKFETGKSLEEYFEFRRLDTARRLLSEGMHTPAAVARLLGYPNVQCFSLIFKRVVGVPPGEFRYSRN